MWLMTLTSPPPPQTNSALEKVRGQKGRMRRDAVFTLAKRHSGPMYER